MKKTNKIISLLLVLSLLVCACPFAAAQGDSSDEEPYVGFHAPTIRKLIDVNLACGNADEEFFHLLANAYLADPELLIETIMDLPDDDIAYLAKTIAYDLQKTQRQSQANVQLDSKNTEACAVNRLIATEVADTSNATLNAFVDNSIFAETSIVPIPDADMLVQEESVQIILSLAADETDVATRVRATVSCTSSMWTSTSRRYNILFYKVRGTEVMQCGLAAAIIDPHSLTTTVSTNLVFNATGEYTVYAKIYDPSDTLLGTSSSVPITVWGQWHIDVVLPANRNYKGTIALFDASGTTMLTGDCLGQSVSGDPMDVEFGRTPTGEYIGYLGEHYGATSSYGPYLAVRTEPISGIVKTSGREDIWIHGGDPITDTTSTHYPLRVTEGCVRVTNGRQLQIQNTITNLVSNQYHDAEGTVSIRQVD